MRWRIDGGDVGDAEAILLAVPGGRVAEVLDACGGLEGRTVLDATNLIGAAPPDGFASNAEYVKSRTGGPTAKTFNLNFAALYDRIDDARSTPCNVWCGDEEAREVVERLNADAGYEPSTPAASRTPARRRPPWRSSSPCRRAGWGPASTGWPRPVGCSR